MTDTLSKIGLENFNNYLQYCDAHEIDPCEHCAYSDVCDLLMMYEAKYIPSYNATSCLDRVSIILDWRANQSKKKWVPIGGVCIRNGSEVMSK